MDNRRMIRFNWQKPDGTFYWADDTMPCRTDFFDWLKENETPTYSRTHLKDGWILYWYEETDSTV